MAPSDTTKKPAAPYSQFTLKTLFSKSVAAVATLTVGRCEYVGARVGGSVASHVG